MLDQTRGIDEIVETRGHEGPQGTWSRQGQMTDDLAVQMGQEIMGSAFRAAKNTGLMEDQQAHRL